MSFINSQSIKLGGFVLTNNVFEQAAIFSLLERYGFALVLSSLYYVGDILDEILANFNFVNKHTHTLACVLYNV